MSTADSAAPFAPRTVVLIIGAGVIAFLALLALAAYAPDLRGGRDGRAHALSVSGDGYAGLVALTDAIGSHALIVRDPAALATPALLIATPQPDGDPKALARLLAARDGHPTLIVLPKWVTRPVPGKTSWRQALAPLPPPVVAAMLAAVAPDATIVLDGLPAMPAAGVPRLVRAAIGRQTAQQRIEGAGLVPLLLDVSGRIVLARLPHRPIYILAEPDLLNNQGLADRWTARQGWTIIDDLSTDNEIAFDLTLDGFGGAAKNPLRLMLSPPFLPVTLCILLAGLLAGLHGAVRFGAPATTARAIPPGTRTLVDNAALLFRAARKEHRTGDAYAALTRDLTAQAAAAPGRLTGEALDQWLDRAAPEAGDPPFATLAWQARVAEDRDQLLAAARALYRWRRNRTR